LFLNKLHAVYHGEAGIRTLKELARSYLTITRDLTRVMNRLKAIYRGWGIARAGQQVYAPRYRAAWLAKIAEAGVRRRAQIYYQQFDVLAALRQEARRELLAEARKHPALRLLRQIPAIGPIRAALLIALMQTPHRLGTKRQLWAYCGLALRIYDSGEYRFVGGQLTPIHVPPEPKHTSGRRQRQTHRCSIGSGRSFTGAVNAVTDEYFYGRHCFSPLQLIQRNGETAGFYSAR
jgi:transposase IS116/IS110/IS902 family protein